ncbi:MAG: carboxylesterase family protein [Oscillospiraceae bacterium]|nr:carboxylesterase family protein [Oscillospiraceae bacterium]
MLRIAKTESGLVRGIQGSDVRTTIFKGIPFAADPVGENRWRAPQPVEPWEGIRDCTEFAPITVQKVPGINPDAFYSKEWHCDPEVPMDEAGSLALNIWTPAKTGDEKLPVMVWIFGGGLQEGYCHEMEFDGEALNRRGVILVSIAYRLNVFGFLAHPDLCKEDPEHPTNFGLLDQNYALAWVQRNIANFGGDPNNVTIYGQSAGGGSTMYHCTSPKSKGLFQKAIAQSCGGVVTTYPKCFMPCADPMDVALEKGVHFIKDVLGCDSVEEARKLDWKYIEEKYHESHQFFNAVIDGKFVVDQWYERAIRGEMNPEYFMTGNTNNEFFLLPKDDKEKWLKDNFGEHAEEYREACDGDIDKKIVGFDLTEKLMCEALADKGHAAYYYTFGPTIPGDNAGAFHSSELWFTFETLHKCWRPFDGHHYDLARKMCNYWTNFAKTGNPNGLDQDGTPMPEWKKYSREEPNQMLFFDEVKTTTELTKQTACMLKLNRFLLEDADGRSANNESVSNLDLRANANNAR